LVGWNAGNEFAYRAILSQDPTQRFLTLASSQIETYWRWNYRRALRQREVGDTAFVPRIFFFDVDGQVRTGVAWGDGIPIVLPVVDLVLVPRRQFAPRRWFRSKVDIVVFTWADLEPILGRYQRVSGEPVCYELLYDATPPEIERMIRGKQPPSTMPKGVAF